jgi:Helix-turn-helix family
MSEPNNGAVPTMSLPRAMWKVLEPYHAMIYFSPEARAAYSEAGLKGYWMGYFASRSAALGPVGPEVVAGTHRRSSV